jgi:hypothetical protein
MFIVRAYQTSMELLSTWCCTAAFFSASGVALSLEAADSKINDQSACSLDTRYSLVMVHSGSFIFTAFAKQMVCFHI